MDFVWPLTRTQANSQQLRKPLLLTVRFFEACAISLLLFQFAARADPANPGQILQELFRLDEAYTQAVRSDEVIEAALSRIDNQIRQMLAELFTDGRSFDDIKLLTKRAIRWELWPADPSRREADQLRTNREPLCVFYSSAHTRQGDTVYCLANSFLASSNRIRVSLCPYIILVSRSGHVVSSLLPNISVDMTGIETPPVFLGFIYYEGALPSPLMLAGPHGSGAFLRLSIFAYSDELSSWTSKQLLECSPVADFLYNDKTHELKYKVRLNSTDRGGYRLQEFAFVVPKTFKALTNESGPFDK